MRIHVFEVFYVHKSRCFVIDYVYKREFADNYATSFVPVCHMQGGYDLVDVFDIVFVIFPQLKMVFRVIVVFYHVGGCYLILELVFCSLEAIIHLKSDKSCDQICERDH